VTRGNEPRSLGHQREYRGDAFAHGFGGHLEGLLACSNFEAQAGALCETQATDGQEQRGRSARVHWRTYTC
jgi:hypothetical protein